MTDGFVFIMKLSLCVVLLSVVIVSRTSATSSERSFAQASF